MFFKTKRDAVHLALFVGVVLFACSSAVAQDVHYNFMPGTDFSKYHTYKWIDLKENVHPNQIVQQEIRQAIDGQLTEKGLTKTDGDTADLYVGYQCAIDRERQWNAYNTGGFGRWGGGMGTATSSTIENGTLVLDMYDPTSKQLVWTGKATKTLNPSGNQEKDMKRLDSAAKKLLKDFPPPTKK